MHEMIPKASSNLLHHKTVLVKQDAENNYITSNVLLNFVKFAKAMVF